MDGAFLRSQELLACLHRSSGCVIFIPSADLLMKFGQCNGVVQSESSRVVRRPSVNNFMSMTDWK